MRPEHLDLLYAAGRPSLTPDGAVAVVAVARPDVTTDRYASTLWVVPTDGSAARPLTSGDRDTSPAVSPDGARVAFLRAGDGTPPQIHLTSLHGGEPVRLTDQPLGAGAPVWSPDGGRLAWVARVPEPGRYGTPEVGPDGAEGDERKPEAEAPRLITELQYRIDDVGFTRDRRRHVFVVDVPPVASDPAAVAVELPLAPIQLTDGDADDRAPEWSPDGSAVAFVSARHATREDDLREAVHLVAAAPAATGGDDTPARPEPVAVTEGDLSIGAVTWLPDGRIAVVADRVSPTGTDFVGRPPTPWVSDRPATLDGGVVELVPLADESTLHLDAAVATAGGGVLVRNHDRGTVTLLRFDPDAPGSDPETVLAGALAVTGHAATADGSTIVVAASTTDRVGDVGVARGGHVDWLTDLSDRLRSEAGVIEPIDVVAPTADGHEVHGWVLLPDPTVHGDGPHPVLLNIHGGPYAQYPATFFDEAQVYAGAGYAVVMCNPRGSAGYGFEHGRAIRHAVGSVDADDVLAFLDHVLASDLPLDPVRVGVMGGSYGGYMTALLTTRTDRFAAAIVERGYLDATSFVGSSDIGWFFPGEYHGSPEGMITQSPMSAVDAVTTPTLVIHSEHDWRCPVEQGQRWFTALRKRGVPAELLLFPGEGHELSRSGRPRHRKERFDHILRWWERYLPVGT